MAKVKSPKTQNKRRNIGSLSQDFESVAKRLGADEDKDRFEAKLGKIAKAKPKAKGKQ
jgi:hypothetical protein